MNKGTAKITLLFFLITFANASIANDTPSLKSKKPPTTMEICVVDGSGEWPPSKYSEKKPHIVLK